MSAHGSFAGPQACRNYLDQSLASYMPPPSPCTTTEEGKPACAAPTPDTHAHTRARTHTHTHSHPPTSLTTIKTKISEREVSSGQCRQTVHS